MKRIITAALIILTAACGAFAGARFGEVPYYRGNWENIGRLGGEFYLVDTETVPENSTEIKIAYDRENLYIKAVCHELSMENVITHYSGGEIWRNDCIEVFIDAILERKVYYQFIVSVDGQIYGWDYERERVLDWTGKTEKGDDRWVAEIRIPFSVLGIEPLAGKVLNVSFCRERRAEGVEFSTWTPPRGFGRPEEFGVLVLGAYHDAFILYAEKISREIRKTGALMERMELPKDVSDEAAENIRILKEIADDGRRLALKRRVSEEDFREWWMKYERARGEVDLDKAADEMKIESFLFGN